MNDPSLLASAVAVGFVFAYGLMGLLGILPLVESRSIRRSLLCLALPIGASITQAWTILLLFVRVPTGSSLDPVVLLFVLVAINALITKQNLLRMPLREFSINSALVAFTLVLASVFIHSQRLVSWHSDSLQHLAIGRALSNNNFADVNIIYREMRGISFAPFISLADRFGGQYGSLMAPLISVSILLLIALSLTESCVKLAQSSSSLTQSEFTRIVFLIAIGGAGLGVFLASDRFHFHFAYINSHVLFAAQIISFIFVGHLTLKASDSAALPRLLLNVLCVALLIGIVASRAEGLLIIAPAGAVFFSFIRGWLGFTMTVLVSILAVASKLSAVDNVQLQDAVTSGHVLVILAAAATGIAMRADARNGCLPLEHPAIVLSLLTLAALVNSNVRSSLPIAFENLLGGAGSWGSTFYLLIVLASFSIFLRSYSRRELPNQNEMTSSFFGVALRTTTLWYFPIMIFTHALRGSSGRLGHNDSFNRAAVTGLILFVFWISSGNPHRRLLRPSAI